MGTYSSDREFLSRSGVDFVELVSDDGLSRVLLAPSMQGRVLTSSANSLQGKSHGWINRGAIASSQINPQFNNYGGEERFWLGPEGGLNSWYFAPGSEQTFPNWKVPSIFDTEAFDLLGADSKSASFQKDFTLVNAKGVEFSMRMGRKVTLLEKEALEAITGPLPGSVSVVAYQSVNSISNLGEAAWTEESGMPSVWMLGMFKPSETTTVFIPYDSNAEGKIVKDDYFGEMPSDRLSVRDGFVFFKIDGAFRSKIGIPGGRSLGLVGAFDPEKGLLTILKADIPAKESLFVNSQWGEQDYAFGGDALNTYNDGPTEDGTIMGPFFEMESSSPAAALSPGESLAHTQTTIHIEGSPETLKAVIAAVFGSCPF